MPDIEASYRRLLIAYPRSYRRERGLEILTTLLDAAGSQVRRPSWRDAIDLVIGGIRYRLAPPRGWLYRFAAVLVAVFIGFTASSLAATAAWMSSPTMAPVTQTPALFSLVPEKEVQVHDPAPLHHDWLGKGTPWHAEGWSGLAPAPGYVQSRYRPDTDLGAIITTTHHRLSTEGWQVGDLVSWESGFVFWAAHEDQVVRVQGIYLDGSAPSITVQLHHAEPGHVTVVAVGALVLGIAFGWLIVCAVLRRSTRLASGWWATVLALGLPAVAAMAVLNVAGAAGTLMLILVWGSAQHHWLSFAATLSGMSLITIIAAFGLVGSVLVTLIGPTTTKADRGPITLAG